MKVFNITDVETKKLKQHHALKQTYVISEKEIAPGGSAEYDETVRSIVMSECVHLVGIGALVIDELPEEYRKKKATSQSSAPPAGDPDDAPAVTVPAAHEDPSRTKKKS
jgi:hypothetical protein